MAPQSQRETHTLRSRAAPFFSAGDRVDLTEGLKVSKVKVGIVGSRFQADCIAASVKMMPDEAEVVAVASPTPGNAEAFAKRHGIQRAYGDYRELLRDKEGEMISVTAPNRMHA